MYTWTSLLLVLLKLIRPLSYLFQLNCALADLLEVCTLLDIPLEALLMGCLQTKHASRPPHLLDTREAVALAAETSCEKVGLPDFVNVATGTLHEN